MDQAAFNSIRLSIEQRLYSKVGALIEAVKMQEAATILFEADPLPQVEKDHKGQPVIPSVDQFIQYFDDMKAEHIRDRLKTAQERWKTAADQKSKTGRNMFSDAQLTALQHELSAASEVLPGKIDEARKSKDERENERLAKQIEKNKLKNDRISQKRAEKEQKKHWNKAQVAADKKRRQEVKSKSKADKIKKKWDRRQTSGASRIGQHIDSAVGALSGYSPLAQFVSHQITKRVFK